MAKLGWTVMIATYLVTIWLWLSYMGWGDRVGNTTLVLVNIGRISGLLGMVMFSQSIILSTRVKWMEKFFGGMDKIYIAHHMIGGVSFILLLIHPLALALSYLPDIKAAANFLIPEPSNWPVYFGISSLMFMMAFLVVTFFVKLPYQLWKQTHKFLGVAFFIGGIHSFFIPSDISNYQPLYIFMAIIVGMGLICWIYRTVLGAIMVKKHRYEIIKTEKLNNSVMAVTMKPTGLPLKYKPGQFVYVSFEDQDLTREYHPFSLVSAPKEENIRVMVKYLGDFTKSLDKLTEGTGAKVEGAYGQFYKVARPELPQIWIAGGIGIAPFLGIAKSLDLRANTMVDLYYCAAKESDLVSLNEFKMIAEANPNFRIFPFVSEKYGRMDSGLVDKLSGQLENKEIFLCGPGPMMTGFKKQFKNMGIKLELIHSEEFSFI
jgi:predicted ferric reductase